MSTAVKLSGVIGSLIAVGGPLASNSTFLEQWQQFFQLYRNGKESALDSNTHDLIYQVESTVETNPGVKFFPCSGSDPVFKGIKSKAIIGLPGNFQYTKHQDVCSDKLVIMGDKPIDFDTDMGKTFINSIVLSDDAKKFAIVRQLEYINNNYVYVRSVMQGLTALAVTGSCVFLSRMLPSAPSGVKYSLYGFTSGLLFYIHLSILDTYRCRLDRKVDKNSSKLGVDYLKGGIEFYQKSLHRNCALRSLMGGQGIKAYTVYGNVRTGVLRTPQLPLTARRDNLTSLLQKQSNR